MKEDNKFLLACTRDNVGSNMAFHAKNGCGYTTDIDKAHIYSLLEAQRAWNNGRDIDQPVSLKHIASECVLKVDCQYLPNITTLNSGDRYYGFVKNKWDGNDLYFLTEYLPSTNFKKAKIFRKQDIKDDDKVFFIPADLVVSALRMTFNHSKFNARKMVQACGLVIPDHIKRQRRRRSSGKTRWNCPSCGRISWQYNPYDFEGCSNIDCDGWRSIYA